MIELSWPVKALHPNARVHWAAKGRATKAARTEAYWATKKAAMMAPPMAAGSFPLIITFYPPDNRKRDHDGQISAFKAFQDGIADALGIDDNLFRPRYQFAEPVKNGRVTVIIGEPA